VVDKEDAITWKERGNSLAKQGNYEGAIACYNTGLGINPTNIDILHNKSAILLKLGRNDEAQEFIRQIQELKNPPTVESKPMMNDIEVPIISIPPRSKLQDIEEISHVVQEEKINNPPTAENTNFKKAFCRYCGSELKFSEAEICPNCGMRLKEPPKSSPQLNQNRGTELENLKHDKISPIPLIVFILSLFLGFFSGFFDAVYFLYALFGILALYWIYKGSEKERKYIKFIGLAIIVFGILIVVGGIVMDAKTVAISYGRDVQITYSLLSYSIFGGTSNYLLLIKIAMMINGLFIGFFGFLLYRNDTYSV
jgi:hypothetical protein